MVAENLVAMLGTPRVTLFPQTLSADADYRVAIEVQSFESAPGEAATLDAVWTVRRTKDGKTQTGRTTVREAAPEKGYDALAAAHSRARRALSQDIADAVRALDRSWTVVARASAATPDFARGSFFLRLGSRSSAEHHPVISVSSRKFGPRERGPSPIAGASFLLDSAGRQRVRCGDLMFVED